MAYAYVQSWANSANGNTVTIAPSAGSLLVFHVVTSTGGGSPTWTVDDNLTSGSYVAQFGANAVGGTTYFHGAGYKLNVSASATTLTFTFNGGTPGETNIEVFEYSGIATSGAYITGILNEQAAPGTGTDALTTTAFNVASGVPALVLAMGCSRDTGVVPTTGTGWTSRYSTKLRLEDVRATSTGNQTATFTVSDGAEDYSAIGMAFSEPAGGGPADPPTRANLFKMLIRA
jgi:hypothetical protein